VSRFDVLVLLVGTAAAVAASQWPKIAPLLKRSAKPAAPSTVTYQQSLEALAVVRARLAVGGAVPEDAQKAIETITLALVKGS